VQRFPPWPAAGSLPPLAWPRSALLDVNVLVALAWPHHLHHSRAHAWLGSHPAGFLTTPITESALIRLSLNRTVTGSDVTPGEVLALVAAM
jgi:uncharacterized protein